MGKKYKAKFEFGTDFQQLILQYTVTDPLGYKIISFYEDHYFTLISHSIICWALKQYYKKNKRIPDEIFLREYLRTAYTQDKDLIVSLTPEDKTTISNIITTIYGNPIKFPEEVVDKCINFARYVRFKKELEVVDINNYGSYESSITKLKAANNIGVELQENYGTFAVAGMNDRAHRRDLIGQVYPTPYQQLNSLCNSGGLTPGSVIVILSKEKRFKTGFLINTARGYMRLRKKGVYIDLENGEVAIVNRTEQSLSNQEHSTITSGDYDNKLMKMLRKYKRLGAELVIKKFPALSTTTDTLQVWLDKLYIDLGFKPHYAIIDYGLLMGATSGKTDEFNRISDAFLDIKNFAERNELESVWTAAHITREGDKRSATIYKSTDIAKCIDIPRHVDAVFGLQENEDEVDAGVMRLEVVEQRNGMRNGNALFWVDIPRQRMREFTKSEIKEYRSQTQGNGDSEGRPKPTNKKRRSDL